MKTKKVLNIKPQEVCEGGEHYVRYKGCDGRMHELPTHTVTHNERVKEMFITQIDELHSVIMSAELTNPEARAVFQASFPNAPSPTTSASRRCSSPPSTRCTP